MEQNLGIARWTRAYLEWTEEADLGVPVELTERRPDEAFAAPVESFAEVYLEWLQAA